MVTQPRSGEAPLHQLLLPKARLGWVQRPALPLGADFVGPGEALPTRVLVDGEPGPPVTTGLWLGSVFWHLSWLPLLLPLSALGQLTMVAVVRMVVRMMMRV